MGGIGVALRQAEDHPAGGWGGVHHALRGLVNQGRENRGLRGGGGGCLGGRCGGRRCRGRCGGGRRGLSLFLLVWGGGGRHCVEGGGVRGDEYRQGCFRVHLAIAATVARVAG